MDLFTFTASLSLYAFFTWNRRLSELGVVLWNTIQTENRSFSIYVACHVPMSLVFANAEGKANGPGVLSHDFARMANRAGLESGRFVTYGLTLLASCCSGELSQRLSQDLRGTPVLPSQRTSISL